MTHTQNNNNNPIYNTKHRHSVPYPLNLVTQQATSTPLTSPMLSIRDHLKFLSLFNITSGCGRQQATHGQ